MSMSGFVFSVFTKPWKIQPIEKLAERLKQIGFDGIEFPLRDGYQVEPANAVRDLPAMTRRLSGLGIQVTSVASKLEEPIFQACALAGVPMIRIMANFSLANGYLAGETAIRHTLDEAVPWSLQYGVKIGIQHHYGTGVSNSMELQHLISGFDPRQVGAIWDAAHSALAGEDPEQGLQILWPWLCMVNLKNACYRQAGNAPGGETQWERYFTTGDQGLSSWRRVAATLTAMQYQGTICLTAEYSDEDLVDVLIARDIAYARLLLTGRQPE